MLYKIQNSIYLSTFQTLLKKQQNFDGLVTIQNTKNPKYIVDGNVLKAYPDSKITGNVQVDVFQGIKNTDGYKLKNRFLKPFLLKKLNLKLD